LDQPAPEAPPKLTARREVLAEHLSKTYRRGRIEVAALVDVSLAVDQGEFVAIMGPSGSGKSTLLNLIAGLGRPTTGSIHVAGECISSMSDDRVTEFRRRRIGYVHQRFMFLPDLTIAENVGIALVLDGRKRPEVEERVAHALEQVGLDGRADHLPTEVSGGELQRAAIARALVADPAVLLADEPTGNLDSYAGERVLLEMRRTVDELGRTIILVTHDAKAAAVADRTETLLDGRIRAPRR
jgi:putative ABC transport system ATP-binding protein